MLPDDVCDELCDCVLDIEAVEPCDCVEVNDALCDGVCDCDAVVVPVTLELGDCDGDDVVLGNCEPVEVCVELDVAT